MTLTDVRMFHGCFIECLIHVFVKQH